MDRLTGGPDLLGGATVSMYNPVLFLYFEYWPNKVAGPNNWWPY